VPDEQDKSAILDRLLEVADLRRRGYSAAEIRALLSSDKWLGNANGDSIEPDMLSSGLLPEIDGRAV
jgi:hypothetical protein